MTGQGNTQVLSSGLMNSAAALLGEISVCVTAEAPVTGVIDTRTGNLQRRDQQRRSFCLILFFPFLFQARHSLNFNFQLVKIQNSHNLSAACKMPYASEGVYMQRYYLQAQSL